MQNMNRKLLSLLFYENGSDFISLQNDFEYYM